MSKTLLFTILFTTCQVVFGQKFLSKIDSLNSDADVEKLIHSFNETYRAFKLKPVSGFNFRFSSNGPCKEVADFLGITKSFYKADFDNNGYSDLLAIGDYYDFQIFVVMNYGRDSLKLNRLTRRSFQECTFPKILNDTIIRYYFMPENNWHDKVQLSSLKYIDLTFKYGDFVEYNPKPLVYSIEKIEYQTTTCFGICPKFYISILKDKSSFFKAEAYNRESRNSKEVNGTYSTTLTDTSFLEIINLLNYIDFPNLKNNYDVGWTDDQTCILTVTYDNGHVKTISDYGLIGTYGLERLYQLLFDLRFNQKWK